MKRNSYGRPYFMAYVRFYQNHPDRVEIIKYDECLEYIVARRLTDGKVLRMDYHHDGSPTWVEIEGRY